MHSTYLSSMSLWRKGSLSFSFNDSSYLLSERTENLHSSSSHCTCCALSNHGLPVYPRFFYGFTHASLIQWSASRRLILTGFERYCQLPLYDLDRGSYRVSCSLNESNACRRRRKRGNGKFGCMVWEEKSEGGDSGTDESAEAMLSLLTDELSDTLVGRSTARRKPVDKIGRVVDQRRRKGKECVRNKSLEWDSKGGYKPITVESREDNYHQSGWSEASLRTENHVLRKDGHRKEKECAQAPSSQRNYKGEYKSSIVKTTEECYQLSGRRGVSSSAQSPGFRSEHPRMEREIAQAPSSERNSKVEYESSTVKSREDYFQLSGRNGVSSTTEDHGPRRDGSGCSSFYSASSFDDIESDTYIEDKHPEFVGGSSCDYKQNESRTSREDVLALDVRKQFKGHDEDVHGYREISRQGSAAGSAVGSDKMMSSNKWGSRSKAEKKFTEISVVPVQSREESSQMLSRKLEVNDSDMEIVLGHQKGFNGREDEPSSAVKLVKETVERNSQSGRVALEHAESRRKSQQVQEMSGIQGSDYQKASGFQRQFSGREMNLSSPINSNQVAGKLDGQTVTETVEQTEIRRKSQQRTKFTDSKIQRAHTSGMRFESGMDNREELSTKMQGSVQKSKEQQVQTDQRFYGTAELRRRSQDLTNQMASDASKNFNRAHTFSDTRMNSRERNLASVVVDQVHEERQNGRGAGERGAEQVGLRKESRRPTKVSSSWWSSMERASTSKAPLYSDPLARVELKGVSTEENKISQVTLAHPSQLVDVKIGNEDLEASVELSESSSSSLTTHPQAQTANSPHELHVETKSGEAFGENLSLMLHEDALGSANRFERSSSQFVGEFVEKVQDEIFTSDFQKERTSETTSAYGDWKYIQQGPGQSGSEDLQLKRPDPRQSSDVSEKKGPSDEMWDVNDPSLHGDSQREPPEEFTSTTGGTIVRTTGRSLWNIITDVIRLRWGTHSGTNNSTTKSGGKSPSNESIRSEVGFSGHDPDDNDHDNVKKRQRGTPKVPRSADLLSKASTQSQAEASESTMSGDRILEAEGDASSYSGTLGKGVTSQGTSSASVEERFDWKEDGNGNQGTPSTIAPMESSLPLLTRRVIRSSPVTEQLTGSTKAKVSIGKDVTSQGTSLAFEEARFGWKEEDRGDKGSIVSLSPVDSSLPLPSRGLIRSPAIEWMPETIKAKVPMCDFKENVEQATTESLTEVPKTDGKDDQLKRQKFLRNKQVPKDIFDEWENAYKLETLRRENDEKFMREALLEAQKAADVWEVPVGAVLVQNGEIIARGFNLVEELRDSTAHAEMICIREASNLLRTWRLVDTTLYVTLEPCPMCAGAILQARIDTVVWGAPNKLLGADGSWVRLFPGGGEGGSSSDQPAGPIHPFHSKITIRRGVLETQCAEMMQQFFNLRRKKKEKNPEPKTPPSCLPVSSHPSKFLSKMHDMFSIMFCL